ncbi:MULTISPECIES: hypothetical protein [Cellulomonas]|uniref:Uncharacterized protein n=1 Tax=Cellulomonas gilvus (strain ATCC 13127 / NRRL B-14078) TaxID=593907 RepID=F8A0Q3_CELGA|nr:MULTISPECIES: hypothetical protein [Cellulomonas]AEI12738.1 hypothetical protein Celgi_2238 [Cellulomonas gilvus ATCC 13127]MCR6689511.1 hypothetical protein [Cellulomonas sp.]
MSTWLILIILGVVLLILGLAGIAKILIWIGVAVLVVSLIMSLLGRRRV